MDGVVDEVGDGRGRLSLHFTPQRHSQYRRGEIPQHTLKWSGLALTVGDCGVKWSM